MSTKPDRCTLAALLAVLMCRGLPASAVAQCLPPAGWILTDPAGDAALYRTDAGADGPISPPVLDGRAGNIPDVLSIRWGGWQPFNMSSPGPKKNFRGVFTSATTPPIFRIDITFAGLVNPPGPLGFGGAYQPYLFGNSPVYGFIDIDLDGNTDTGGELGPPARQRYPAVVGRMGEVPAGPLFGRTAFSGVQLDSSFQTAPHFERSGADFTVSFCGCFQPEIVDQDDGDCDGIFEPGETWIVRGRFFQRAGGFAAASAAYNGSQPGLYDPMVYLRFAHRTATDTTTVSLVYGASQVGAAKLRCGSCPPQPVNLDVSDDTSIQEAMADICAGAKDPFLPIDFPETWTLSSGWTDSGQGMDALYLDKWVFRAALATVYSTAQPDAPYVWTDAGFDQRRGDFNGDGAVNASDRAALVSHVWFTDNTGFDCDHPTYGSIGVCSFGTNFSVFDLNYDGYVNAADASMLPESVLGDFNGDCAVTTADLIFLLGRFSTVQNATILTGDLNGDGQVNTLDIIRLLPRFATTCPPALQRAASHPKVE